MVRVLASENRDVWYRSLPLFITLVLLGDVYASLPLYEGDQCQTTEGGRGECRRVTQCQSALEAIWMREREMPRRCGFVGWEEIVCCPLQRPFNPHSPGEGGGRRPRPIGSFRPKTSTAVPGTSDGKGHPVTLRPFGRITTPRSHRKKSSGKAQEACERYRSMDEQRIGWFILGGEEVSEGEFPHMAALGYRRQGQNVISWRCGGTLISERYVLTAAHCLTDKYAGVPKLVRVGEVDLRPAPGGAGDYKVEARLLHPRYKQKFNYDDVGLLRLATSVAFTQNMHPACLPAPTPPDTSSPSLLRRKLIVTGWGATDSLGTAPSPVLLKTNLSLVPLEECRSLHRTSSRIPEGISANMICAGDPSGVDDTCVGDSGGPLQILEDPRSAVHTVVGITSFGPDPCGGKKPGVYVRVASYVPWIESVVWE